MFDQHVKTELNFIHPINGKPAVRIGDHREDLSRNYVYEPHETLIRDARGEGHTFDLNREGFTLRYRPSAARDFADDQHLRDIYYPETADLIAEASGASKVVIFDHTVRLQVADDPTARKPVLHVHNDYTESSAPRRVLDVMGETEGRRLLAGRFQQINAWRPIGYPVETMPLAIADARSVGSDDVVPTDLVYPDRTGEILEFTANDEQQWYYFPDMTPSEVLLIKGFDSNADAGSRFVPHTAFQLPFVDDNARPRQSIEIRAFAFFEDA